MFPISDDSFNNYIKFSTSDNYEINYKLLAEALYFNDTHYLQTLSCQDLTGMQFQHLNFITQYMILQQRNHSEILNQINFIEENLCKAYLKHKSTKEYVRILFTEYILQLNEFGELLSSTVTPSTQESEETEVGEWKNRLVQYLFSELITDQWVIKPTLKQLQYFIQQQQELRFIGFHSLKYAQLLINNGARRINLSKNNLQSVELTWGYGIISVDLSNNLINDQTISLLDNLLVNTLIRKLRLDYNQISQDGCLILSEMLGKNQTLVELYLGNNKLQNGIQIILQKLSYHPQLTFLDISNNYLGNQMARQIIQFLKINKSIQIFRCYDTTLSRDSIESILEQTNSLHITLNLPISQDNSLKYTTIQQRREYERDLFYSFQQNNCSSWYLISEQWLQKWREFIQGGSVPGEVNNSHLNKDSQPIIDYRGLSFEAWTSIIGIYGGGPVIKRDEILI